MNESMKIFQPSFIYIRGKEGQKYKMELVHYNQYEYTQVGPHVKWYNSKWQIPRSKVKVSNKKGFKSHILLNNFPMLYLHKPPKIQTSSYSIFSSNSIQPTWSLPQPKNPQFKHMPLCKKPNVPMSSKDQCSPPRFPTLLLPIKQPTFIWPSWRSHQTP